MLQNQNENKNKQANELLYFPSGNLIKQISLDYKTTVTNYMWLQTVQYYGSHMLTDKDLHQLYNLFDIITELDPNLLQCYVFGGTIITYDQRSPELGMKLMLKGMSNLPDSWQVPFIAGFLNYMYTRDYFAAYKWFSFASEKPDAPYYCKTFAAAAKKREGDYITALKLWTQIYNNSSNKLERENAIKNMVVLLSLDFNKNLSEKGIKDIKDYINEEFKKMQFLPFSSSVKIMEDTVIVESR
ncbi:MAG: hypothetical protein PHW02_06560 [bacterium]|nr:hypothetical protein [bacterium]